jgi:hypothetical protein
MRRLLALLLLAPLLLIGVPAHAQASWSVPFEVSTDAPFSWFPDITAGPDGSVHIIWASGDANPADPKQAIDLLRYRSLRNGSWSKTNDIAYAGKGGYTVRNSIALGRDGRFYALVRMGQRAFAMSAAWEDAWSARAWSAPAPVSPPGGYYTALGIDSHNTLHALWSGAIIDDPQKPRKDCPNCSDLFYRNSSDGGQTWSALQNLSQTDEGENRPQIVIDGRDHIHAVWDQGVDWYAGGGVPTYGVYRRSNDGGSSWSAAVRFGSPEDPIQQIALTTSTAGNPFVVYRSAKTDRLFSQWSSDGGTSWTAPVEIPIVRGRSLNDNNLDRYSLATDSAGKAHLLMSGFIAGSASDTPPSNPWLLHLVWNGQAWSVPQVVMGNDLYPEWPRIIVSGGNQLHAVWFTRHKADLFGSDKGAHYQVWYSSLSTDAPAVAAPPTFTPAPTAAPTVALTPTPEPSPTPLPASILDAPTTGGPPRWEQQGIVTIALAILPTLGILGLIVGGIIAVRRRR